MLAQSTAAAVSLPRAALAGSVARLVQPLQLPFVPSTDQQRQDPAPSAAPG